MQVKITETQGRNARREAYTVNVQSLSAAKRVASRRQFFQGTVLNIKTPGDIPLATKQDGQWITHLAAFQQKTRR